MYIRYQSTKTTHVRMYVQKCTYIWSFLREVYQPKSLKRTAHQTHSKQSTRRDFWRTVRQTGETLLLPRSQGHKWQLIRLTFILIDAFNSLHYTELDYLMMVPLHVFKINKQQKCIFQGSQLCLTKDIAYFIVAKKNSILSMLG